MVVRRLSGKQIENEALIFRNAFLGDDASNICAIDIDRFLEFQVGAEIDYAPLSQDGSILGMTCYEDKDIQIWDAERQNPLIRRGKPKLILIDPDCDHDGRMRFTMAHECAHLLLHNADDFQNDACLSLNDFPTVKGKVTNWAEWQANRFAAALLMPMDLVLEKVRQFSDDEPSSSDINIEFDALSEIAGLFEVSVQAMKIRFEQINKVAKTNIKVSEGLVWDL